MAEKEQKVEEVSGNNKEERCGTTLNKQVTLVAKSGQEKESHKDASALASKCEQLNILYEIYIFSILFWHVNLWKLDEYLQIVILFQSK